MAENDAVRTAVAASRTRALLSVHLDAPPLDDRWALHLLDAADRAIAEGPAGREELHANPIGFSMSGVGVGSLLVAEDVALTAIADGIDQYVILGAGFDTFAPRHPELAGRVHVYEVDRPDVQSVKRERLAAAPPIQLEPVFVPVDFETTTLSTSLLRSPFDPTRRAVVSCMNTLPYVSVEGIAATLHDLGDLLAPGSRLVCNYGARDVPIDDEQRAVLDAMRRNVAARGEPLRSSFRPEEFVALLTEHGFSVTDHLTEHDLNARYYSGRTDGFRAPVPARIVQAVRR